MEQFTLPLASFDVALLPEGARDRTSPEFRATVEDFFRIQFRELGANGVVNITSEQIAVGWIVPGFDPFKSAIDQLKRGQLREGAQLLELIRARRPDDPEVLFNLGVVRSDLGDLERAIETLSHLEELAQGHAHGRVALGVALARTGDYDAALKHLLVAVELAPTDAWAQKNLGGILFRLKRSEEARVHLETAVQVAPQDAHAWFILGETCLSLGDPNAARPALQRARTLDPHGPIRDRAETLLNRLAATELARNAEGINPEALEAMIAALKRLRSMPPEAAKQLTLQAALIGQHGLRLQDPARNHRVDGIPEPLTNLEVACLLHAGVRLVSSTTETGLPLETEFAEARKRIE